MFKAFVQRVKSKDCPKCPGIDGCKPVLQINETDLHKPLMFIAEAPGRLGAEISRIPLHGDQTGDNFNELLMKSGLTRMQCHITNAVLCVPLNGQGKNRTPKESEIKNCSSFLYDQIQLVNPRLIITLGKSSLLTLHKIKKHCLVLPKQNEEQKVQGWNKYYVLPLYHPSQKVMNIYRSKKQQLLDYRKIYDWLHS